jgi:protein-disulfide isomerase
MDFLRSLSERPSMRKRLRQAQCHGEESVPFLLPFLRLLSFSPTLFLGATILLGALAGAAEREDLLAEIDGEAIRTQDVEQALGLQLGKINEQIYELKRKKLEELIVEKLLSQEAEKRGFSVQQLIEAEVTSKVGQVTEAEVDNFYEQSKAKLRGEEKAVRERIKSSLQAQRTAAQKEAFLRQLRAERRVIVHLQPSGPIKIAVTTREGAPTKGLSQAPVVIVEFSDFQCPYCRKALSELEKVLTAYPKEVRLVYRHFPIDRLHPQARLAAQAAECAGAKGRFWEYHDRLFNQADLSLQKLKELAQGLGLDLASFEQCLTNEWTRTRVAQDVEAGTRAGVSGTPTFFINGRRLVGAQPFEAFKTVIEEELAVLRR